MLGISDVKELVDATAEEIDKAYEELCDKIIAQSCPLSTGTNIGSSVKLSAGGLRWKHIMPAAMKLIDDRVLTPIKDRDGIMRVET